MRTAVETSVDEYDAPPSSSTDFGDDASRVSPDASAGRCRRARELLDVTDEKEERAAPLRRPAALASLVDGSLGV